MNATQLFESQQVRALKAVPFKQWLAAEGYQCIQETADEWEDRGISAGGDFAILTNKISQLSSAHAATLRELHCATFD